LIPFFVVELLYYMKTGNEVHRLLGIMAFGLASIFDGVDGYIARRYNQRSELGAMLDPLADKLLLISGVVLLSLNNPYLTAIPLWLTGTIIGRDLLLLVGLVVTQMMVGRVAIHPRFLGKVATVLQMLCVVCILFKWNALLPGPWFLTLSISAALCTGIS